MITDKFLPPPYTFVLALDLRAGNWTKPDDVTLCELRVVTRDASEYFQICVDTRSTDSNGEDYESLNIVLPGREVDIWRINLRRVRQFGTSSNIREGCITVYGYYNQEIINH